MRRESLERRVSRAKQSSSVKRMKTTGICGFIITCFALVLLIDVTPAAAMCQLPSASVSCKENVLNGTMLMKISYPKDQKWSLKSAKPAGYFKLEKGNTSYYLLATKTLDLDELKETANDMSVKLKCEEPNSSPIEHSVIIILKASNEFTPTFTERLYSINISENARIKDPIFIASDHANDKDYEDHMTFNVSKDPQEKNQFDGIASGKFKMADPTKGQIVVNGQLDYEKQKYYEIQIVVKDGDDHQNSTKLKINILDEDDLGPTFLPNPCSGENLNCQIPVLYHAQINAADKGRISVLPNAVKAVDMEFNNYSISYSFTHGEPTNIEKYFTIDAQKGIITKKDDILPKNVTTPINLYIKAEEQSPLKHSSVAILMVDILGRNATIFVSSTKPPDSPSVSKTQGYSPDVFYGVLIPLAIIVAILIIFNIVILVKSKKTRNSVDSNSDDDKPLAPSVVVQTTGSLLSRKSEKRTNGIIGVNNIENGVIVVENQGFAPDDFPANDGEAGDDKKLEQLSTTSTEDNDVHPRSSHSDNNTDNLVYSNLASAKVYPAIENLFKAGVDEEDMARDGDIGNNYSTDTGSKYGTDQSLSDTSDSDKELTDTTNGNESDQTTKEFSEHITDTCLESEQEQEQGIPAPDYILDDAESPSEPTENNWSVSKTSGQLESEISEFLLTPDFIENTGKGPTSSKSLQDPADPQSDVPLENSDPTYMNISDANTGKDEDNALPEWASEALKPTIRPISSREEFKSHLESLISSPPQLPASKTLPSSSSSLASLTPSPSSQSPITTPRGKAPAPPPPPPPPPPPLPSSCAEETTFTSTSPTPPPLPPPLPAIQMMATKL